MTRITPEHIVSLQNWAKNISISAQSLGRKLSEQEISLAKQVGVKNIDQVLLVEADPMPDLPEDLKPIAQQHINPVNAQGLAIGHVVFLRKGHISEKLLRHELRHVYQVELHKGRDLFLMEYVRQILEHGYTDAPFEKDARNAENPSFISNDL